MELIMPNEKLRIVLISLLSGASIATTESLNPACIFADVCIKIKKSFFEFEFKKCITHDDINKEYDRLSKIIQENNILYLSNIHNSEPMMINLILSKLDNISIIADISSLKSESSYEALNERLTFRIKSKIEVNSLDNIYIDYNSELLEITASNEVIKKFTDFNFDKSVSDRKKHRLFNALKLNAFINKNKYIDTSDLWILKYIN